MKKIIKIFFLIALSIISIFLYSRYIATSGLVTNEIVINDKNIDINYDGIKIVHFSDLHYTRIITDKQVIKITEEINLINPDIVVFTGDLIDTTGTLTEDKENFLINALKSINAKYGKYAIIGNHDYASNFDKIKNIYQKSDFMLLENSFDIIYNNNSQLFIGGISSFSHQLDDIDKVLSTTNNNMYKILLIHEPDFADDITTKYNNVNLILSGHSHGGQVRLPFIGPLYTPSNAHKYNMGEYKIDNTILYVSSGIGVSRYNFRLFNRPSINFYRINK